MSASDLTLKQQQAVNADGSLVVVRAGAGSGKTRVLVERYLRLVLQEGYHPQRILAATFTEKAAAEMKERVARALAEANKPEFVAELNAAPICTLHSFCARLIAPYTLSLGQDPAFRILDENEARFLQEEVLLDLLTQWREQKRAELETIVARLKWPGERHLRPGRSPASRGFSRLFLDFVEAVRSAGWSEHEPFITMAISPGEIRRKAEDFLKKLNDSIAGYQSKVSNKSYEKIVIARNLLHGFLEIPDPDPRSARDLQRGLLETLKRIAGETFKQIDQKIKEELCPLLEDHGHQAVYESVRQPLNDLFGDFIAQYRSRKVQSGVVDFLDLEEMALQILRGGSLDSPVDQVLIDEAQDLNPVQWEIINHLRRQANLFAVGDAQQSIYGFRHADVGYFTRLAREASAPGSQEVLLIENFRSRRSILAVVNRLFERIWKSDSETIFLPLEKASSYVDSDDKPVELLVAQGPDRESARDSEAHLLARRLVELHQAQRDPNWGEILVLVRSSSSFEFLERAFRDGGIPFLIQAGRGFWDALEISDLLALLQALENPGDSFSLACVLRSPGVGFDDDDLIALSWFDTVSQKKEDFPEKPHALYEGLVALAQPAAESESLAYRCHLFLDIFQRLLGRKDQVSLRSLLRTWIEAVGLEALWTADPEGHLKTRNVSKFLRLCDQMAQAPLSRLRAAFEELRLRDLHEGSAPYLQEGEGAVRAMTVHAAKGLEAPIIALYDTNYQPKAEARALVFSKTNGAAFTLESEPAEKDPYKPRIYKQIEEERKDRETAESQRLLYVAMTRAREKLLLCGSWTPNEEGKGQIRGWFKIICKHLNLEQELLLDPAILPAGTIYLMGEDGTAAPVLFRRTSDEPSVPYLRGAEAKRKTLISPVPRGFPAPPQPGREPLSVTQYVIEKNGLTIPYTPSEEPGQWEDEMGEDRLELGRWAHRLLEVIEGRTSDSAWSEIARREALLLFGWEPGKKELAEVLRLIENFFSSRLGQLAVKSKQVFREFPLLFIHEGQLLRGKLDLVFQSDEGWVLVDYKSDRQFPADRMRLYTEQLTLYAHGWRGISGEAPHKAILFALQTGTPIEISLL